MPGRAMSRTQTLARPSGEAFLNPTGLHPPMARFHGTRLRTHRGRGRIYIKDNAIETVDFLIFDPRPSWEYHHFADEALKTATQDLLASADDTGCTADLTVASADGLTKIKTDPRKDSLIERTPSCVLSLQMY